MIYLDFIFTCRLFKHVKPLKTNIFCLVIWKGVNSFGIKILLDVTVSSCGGFPASTSSYRGTALG